MTTEEFEQIYFPKYESVIRAIARKLANKNDALAEDLFSEGMVALWRVDPSKAKDNADAYIRQSIKYRLVDWIRKDRPAQFDSLNVYTDRGDQVIQDEDTGETVLLRWRETRYPTNSDDYWVGGAGDDAMRIREDTEEG